MAECRQLTAVVTGGSSGIGAATCQMLLERGHRVVSLALTLPEFAHPDLIAYEVDLADVEATRRISGKICKLEPQIIVHNAGVIRSAPVEDVALDDLDYLVRLSLSSTILLTQACLPAMRRASFGRIIIMSSRAAIGLATRTAYSATKAALIGLTRTWALELGPQGITVNAILPGPITSPMFTNVIPEGSKSAENLIRTLPMRRLGKPEDVARAVLYFADSENSFVTGQALFVCGGASVGYLHI
jgi:3-oxoacyl-[acyl-carrier protein] reductase